MAKDGELRKVKGKKRERKEKLKDVEGIEVVDNAVIAENEVKKKRKKGQNGKSVDAVGSVVVAESAAKKKRKKGEKKVFDVESGDAVATNSVGLDGKVKGKTKEKMGSRKNKRKGKDVAVALDDKTSGHGQSRTEDEIVNGMELTPDASKNSQGKKKKKKKRNQASSDTDQGQVLKHEGGKTNDDDVLYMSSGDDDCSTGMKKWLTEYHDQRPGFEILQQRIDDFIIAHEEKLEQERKEREARIAEDGWTVVGQHKGRKKTTDTESGIVVGSVAQAAAQDKLAKKKQNGVGLDFYRFQKREAQRNQVIMLQSKFEEDKKRIQQLRAARKFRPY